MEREDRFSLSTEVGHGEERRRKKRKRTSTDNN